LAALFRRDGRRCTLWRSIMRDVMDIVMAMRMGWQ
jgi:hypothetical protein